VAVVAASGLAPAGGQGPGRRAAALGHSPAGGGLAGLLALAGVLACVLAGCAGPVSTLQPAGPAAREAAQLWWGMLTVGVIVLIGVVALWLHALRRPSAMVGPAEAKRITLLWLVGGGLLLPGFTLIALLAIGIPAGHRMLPLPLAGGEAPLRIEVIGHQWWWEVHYPDSGVVLADELHLPAGQPVDVVVRSADVIHSFWIPRLAGKIDMVPGRSNLIRLQADEAGEYRGQCAEYCGVSHAFMVLRVVAHEPAAYAAWQQERGG